MSSHRTVTFNGGAGTCPPGLRMLTHRPAVLGSFNGGAGTCPPGR